MFMQRKNIRKLASPLDPNRLGGSSSDGFEMAALVGKTGVPARRIRHWIMSGAVDKPAGRSRAARYSDEHVQQIIDVSGRLENGERLKAIAHQRHSLRNKGKNTLAFEDRCVDGISSSGLNTWHHIAVTGNLYICARVSRSNLEFEIANEMKRVAKTLLVKALRQKPHKRSV